jgi:rubrerythrin
MNWDDEDREDYPEDRKQSNGLRCEMCGATDWPRADTSCPLCWEPETEDDDE